MQQPRPLLSREQLQGSEVTSDTSLSSGESNTYTSKPQTPHHRHDTWSNLKRLHVNSPTSEHAVCESLQSFSGDFSDLDGAVRQRRQEMEESSSSDSQTPDYDKIAGITTGSTSMTRGLRRLVSSCFY